MTFPLLPCIITPKITDLTVEFLKSRDIKLLMMDFDNTIVPYTTDIPTDEVTKWLNDMKQSEIQLCVVSNSKKNRVKEFCASYGIDCITHATKPFSKGIKACMEKYQMPAANCALVGDQIYTDTLGANCCAVQSILVDAIDNHNFWLRARHVLEMPFILAAKKRRITL